MVCVTAVQQEALVSGGEPALSNGGYITSITRRAKSPVNAKTLWICRRLRLCTRPTNIPTLASNKTNTSQPLIKGTRAEPFRSTHASAATAYKKVAVNTPMAWNTNGFRDIHSTRRGEYAVALNCTMTKTREKTIPVNVIMPAAIEE